MHKYLFLSTSEVNHSFVRLLVLHICVSELTNLQDGAEDRRVVHGGTIPSAVPELPLTLVDARFGTAAHAAHVVLVQLAQLGLAQGQPWDLRAQWLGADQVNLRVPPHLVAL